MKRLTERGFERLANILAREYVPSIYACKKCGYPVVNGYICTHCGDDNPSEGPRHTVLRDAMETK